MAATQVQCGVTNNRINREPIDSESVVYSYSNLADKLSARSGVIYGGLITSVINDEEKEKNTERMILLTAQNGRATYALVEATAKAVQRIPDANCNGDMTEALKQARQYQMEEQQFLIDQGVKRIFKK